MDEMTAAAAAPDTDAPGARIGRYRWVIVALLFGASVINYVDRQILGVLKPTLAPEFGWTETDYANIIFWFQAAYAVSYLAFGRFVDKVGARIGYGLAFLIWTLAHTAHALATGLGGFFAARIGLGVGEGGNFPAGLKAIAEWFPKRERAFAIGLFNSGSNIGAIVTPMIVPAITLAWGWRAAFIITGVLSLLWLVAWFGIYRRPQDHKRVTPAELAHIRSDGPETDTPIAWRKLVPVRETWAYSIGKFLIDPIWWMYLFWLPDFFAKTYHLDLKSFGPPLVVVYLLSDFGSIAGGWMSSALMRRGVSVNIARKSTMLLCALLVLPIIGAQAAGNLWLAVGIVGLAAAAHQGFSANLYALPSDVFPQRAVGSVVGIGGMIGAVGGMVFSKYVGQVLETIGTYTPIFFLAGFAYLLALAAVHILSPRLAPAKVG
jgi:ACS family hexuronate transporter-like MFS transporter